jgi:hypothetical protein
MTPEQMQELIERANRDKMRTAQTRLTPYLVSGGYGFQTASLRWS